MRPLTWLGAVGVGTVMLISPLAAQDPVFGVAFGQTIGGNPFHGGIARTVDDSARSQDIGWQFQTFSEWSPAGKKVTLRAEALYSRLTVRSDLRHWLASGASVLAPQPGPSGFQPYVIAGGTLNTSRLATGSDADAGASSPEWAWAPGLNAGAGFAMDLLSLRTGLEVRRFGGVPEEENGDAWIAIALVVRLP